MVALTREVRYSITAVGDFWRKSSVTVSRSSEWRSGTGPSIWRTASTETPSTSRISATSSSPMSSSSSSTPSSSMTDPPSRWRMSMEMTEPRRAPILDATAPSAPGLSGSCNRIR